MLCLVLGESTRRGAGMGSAGGTQVGCSASPGLYRIRASSPGGSAVCLCSQEGSLGAGGGGCCGPISPLLGEPQGSGRCESPQLGQPACRGDTGALDKAFLLFPLFAVEML